MSEMELSEMYRLRIENSMININFFMAVKINFKPNDFVRKRAKSTINCKKINKFVIKLGG